MHTNKSRPFTVPNYVLLLPLSEKIYGVGYFKLFPLKKMQVIALVLPCPAERALASTLRTNLDIGYSAHYYYSAGLTFKHCYMLELF